MLGWLFKKGIDKRFSEMNYSLRNSFLNIKEDMGHISKWVNHFKDKNSEHENKLQSQQTKISDHYNEIEVIKRRLDSVERLIEATKPQKHFQIEKEIIGNPKEVPDISKHIEHKLPSAQYKVCWIMARMQKEDPERWVSLKDLASEVYPDKDYLKSRSAISQLVNILELEGYLAKKKVRKSVYVYLKKSKLNQFIKDNLTTQVKT